MIAIEPSSREKTHANPIPSQPNPNNTDLEQRLAEIEAISAIYPDETEAFEDGSALIFYAPNRAHARHCTVRFGLVESYPSRSPPLIEVLAPHLDLSLLIKLEKDLQDQWIPGEASLFKAIGWLLEQEHLWEIGKGASAEANEDPERAGREEQAMERERQRTAAERCV